MPRWRDDYSLCYLNGLNGIFPQAVPVLIRNFSDAGNGNRMWTMRVPYTLQVLLELVGPSPLRDVTMEAVTIFHQSAEAQLVQLIRQRLPDRVVVRGTEQDIHE